MAESGAKTWERRFRELLAFRAAEGHLRVPRAWSPNPRLATWVMNQRRLLLAGRLTPERARRLREEGVTWSGAAERQSARDAAWRRRFDAAVLFHRGHGHLRVPRRGAAASALSSWLASQRYLAKSGRLSKARRQLLAELGFEWTRPRDPLPLKSRRSRAGDWERRFEELAAYRAAHGHCALPRRGSGLEALARWIGYQRWARRRGLLSRERIQRLDSLYFEWSGARPRAQARERAWNERLAALASFRTKHGHTAVPQHWPRDRRLGAWVLRQRRLRREGRLSRERISSLDALGFSWSRR